MKNSFISLILSACLVGTVVSECPNACSAHGKCGAYDMCTCYRNWMSNDCSERICQFGLAHVDTPKGDLDSSNGALSGPGTTVVLNDAMYPYGTTEQYPFVGDIDGNVLLNTAHEYRECSNKGICDRSTGTCACFEGYDGSACQRASCPITNGATCSGHGTCHTIEELAILDHNNIYELWDKDSTMGCLCDGGYSGADCSEKKCKYGVDPLYYDRGSTVRYSNFTYILYSSTAATTLTGNYSIVFFDAFGEDWQTVAIDYDATCATIVSALEGIPNNVIPPRTVRCYKDTTPTTTVDAFTPDAGNALKVWNRYTVSFPGNPGKLQQIELNHRLDGDRPTLYTDETTSTLGWYVYSNGFIGEDVDMVTDLCDNVLVTLGGQGTPAAMYLDGISTQEAKALKTCLGNSDGDSSNNVEVYNWDYGSLYNPHLIKLVDQTQYTTTVVAGFDGGQDTNVDAATTKVPISLICNPNDINAPLYGTGLCSNKNPAGFLAVLFYDSVHFANAWRLITPAAKDYGASTLFKVYTTKGYLQLVSPITAVYTTSRLYTALQARKSYFSNLLHVTNTSSVSSTSSYAGWMDCETQTIGQNGLLDCLNKNDYVMFLSGNGTDPAYPNMYQVKALRRSEKSYENDPSPMATLNSEKVRTTITLDYNVNHKMYYEKGLPNANAVDTIARVYKFHPDTTISTHGYSYAGPCSNRGNCNTDTGVCECFNGYTNDNCDTINALAV